MPVNSHGFYLNKEEFRDALCLRYGWALPSVPGKYHCGKPFSVEHSMICSTGGFPTIHHNEVCDLTHSFSMRCVLVSLWNCLCNL